MVAECYDSAALQKKEKSDADSVVSLDAFSKLCLRQKEGGWGGGEDTLFSLGCVLSRLLRCRLEEGLRGVAGEHSRPFVLPDQLLERNLNCSRLTRRRE